MNDLNALFGSVDGLKEDVMEYGPIAIGSIAAGVAMRWVIGKFVPQSVVQNEMLRKWGIPVATAALAVIAGRFITRQFGMRKLGLGVTVGLMALAVTSIAKNLAPNLPIAGLAGEEDYYGVAGVFGPVTVEEGVSGPVTVEEGVSGATTVEEFNGFAAALQ